MDWKEHPAEAILGSTLNHKLIVKRKGLPLTDYGLVDERLAKRSRMENTDSVVPSAMYVMCHLSPHWNTLLGQGGNCEMCAWGQAD